MNLRARLSGLLILSGLGLASAKGVFHGPEELGFGEAQEWWRTDAALLGRSEDQRRSDLRAHGNEAASATWQEILGVVRAIQDAGAPGDVVHARGFERNLLWFLHYDLYPLRVTGRYLEEGGRVGDPPPEEADFVLTYRRLQGRLQWKRR